MAGRNGIASTQQKPNATPVSNNKRTSGVRLPEYNPGVCWGDVSNLSSYSIIRTLAFIYGDFLRCTHFSISTIQKMIELAATTRLRSQADKNDVEKTDWRKGT